ncbi:MAG: ferrochelatase [Planctomycetes bacterium]|nr:ferrochelatase [Planctomycetota bacterium]
MAAGRTGALLVHLGTPAAPTRAAVCSYLREFLSDPRVLDMHPLARFLLLRLVILPLRSPRSAAAYRRIWTAEGSPLLVHGLALRDRLRERLPDMPFELAMRYGAPRLEHGLAALAAAGCERVVVFPLYPQHAESTSGSAEAAARRHARAYFEDEAVSLVPPFFADAGFLAACAAAVGPALERFSPDHVLFSCHGLPERQVRAADPTRGRCLVAPDCCAELGTENSRCYRAQCLATTRALALRLGLAPGSHGTSFQSRLGRARWIGPATSEALAALAARGQKRVLVFCPSFTADCLETLEEIGVREAERFRARGGEALELVPALNSRPEWVEAAAHLLLRARAERSP